MRLRRVTLPAGPVLGLLALHLPLAAGVAWGLWNDRLGWAAVLSVAVAALAGGLSAAVQAFDAATAYLTVLCALTALVWVAAEWPFFKALLLPLVRALVA